MFVLPETGANLVHLARVNIGVGKEVNSQTVLQVEGFNTFHLQAVLHVRINISFQLTFVSV